MLSKNEISFMRSLHNGKNRNAEKLFIAEGEKVVSELLQSDFVIRNLCYTDSFLLPVSLSEKICKKISESELEKISTLQTPNKVLAVVEQKKFEIENDLSGITLILDNIKDPGNMGTLVRIADWFGVKRIIASENSVEYYNPKVVMSSMGSLFHLPFLNMKLEELITRLKNKNIPLYTADMNGESIQKTSFPHSFGLAMGSESHGVSELIRQASDTLITIPAYGRAESLNVAVAAGIVLFSAKR